MFIARAHCAMPIDAELRRNGLTLWSAVEFGLEMPWFHATIQFDDEGVVRNRTLFTVVAFNLTDGMPPLPKAKLIEVSLMSPGYLNGTGTWQLAPLREVRSGQFDGRELMMYRRRSSEIE